MNLYFLVEGRRTEKKVYPKWLEFLIPKLIQVKDAFAVNDNNYYIFNGNGFPALLDNHLKNTVLDINNIGKFDYLVICLDSDDDSIQERKNYVLNFIQRENIILNNCKLEIIVQNKCIETWFLGNRKVYSNKPQSQKLKDFNKFYNVKLNDPELMDKLEEYDTSAQFHEAYLAEMLLEKNIRYTKKNPNEVTEKYYLGELIKRTEETKHLNSFSNFISFCARVQKEIV